nr:aromatic acid exporter family protein [Staphylococcus lugdunensis]
MNKWYKNIIGARTIKTGVATFFTTVFCMLLNLTPIFAILTAIVTIEPTAKASLKKGYRRLPATVIGALLAVVFTFIFGDQSPFSYALSATFTILLCTKLNLQVGTTVAVLTSVAMIPGIHEAYIFNFFSRLLTAVIGLLTAGFVNFIILPPKYFQQIEDNIAISETKTFELFSSRI